jgi:hypothetical protein
VFFYKKNTSKMNTQLSPPETYDVNRLVFSKAVKGSAKVAEGSPEIKFSRINILTQNDDGSIGELVLPTTELFSFGVSVNTSMDGSNKISGHSLPLCLWNKDNPLPIEKAFSSKLEDIVEKCKDHLLLDSTMEEIERYELERAQLKKLNSFIYWKKEKGKVVQGVGPTLYPKLIESKKNDKIITSFFDCNGQTIDPLSLIGKYCYVKAAIKIESIFIGANINIQVKVYEAEVRIVESGVKRLLQRPAAESHVQMNAAAAYPVRMEIEQDDDQIPNDDDGVERAPPPVVDTPPRKQIKTIRPKKP